MKRRAIHSGSIAALRTGIYAVLAMTALVILFPGDGLAADRGIGPQDRAVRHAQAGLPANLPVRPVGDRAQYSQQVPDIFQGMMMPDLRRGSDCREPEQIRRRLKQQGWWDFQELQQSGDGFLVRARRPNGSAYQLRIDGCSGRVLEAKRLEGERRGNRIWPR